MTSQNLDSNGQPTGYSWVNRRRVIWASLAFCAGVISYCLIDGEDTTLNQTALTCAFWAGGAIVGSYCFGAAWENRP